MQLGTDGWFDPIGELAGVHEPIAANTDVDKDAKRRMPTHRARVDLPSGEGAELCRACGLLQAQADASLGDINFDNLEGVALSYLYGIGHLGDTCLGQFGDMHQGIFADVDVNKCANGGGALDGAGHIAPHAECCQGRTIHFGAVAHGAGGWCAC